jgi:MscS family membrane protein
MKAMMMQYTLLWKLVFLLILAAVLLGLSHRVLRYLRIKLEARQAVWPAAFLKAVYRPWLVLLAGMLLAVGARMLLLHAGSVWLGGISVAQHALLVLSLFWFLMRFVGFYEEGLYAVKARLLTLQDKTSIRALMQLLRIALFILTVLLMMQVFGQNITALLAFGGVGGLALSFAAKDSLANLLGGMMIFVDRPFSVGEWVRSPDRDIEGTVEYIGWRLTKIRTFDKRPLYVPNGIFSTIAIENPSRMTNRRIKAVFGVRYDDAATLDAIIQDVRGMLQAHPDIDSNQTLMVNFVAFAPSSLDVMVYTFTKTTQWALFQDVRQDVFLKILSIVAQHGAACAFPTSTVHVPDGVRIQPSPLLDE